MTSSSLVEIISKIRLLVLDVDGVLTDGRITYTDDGREIKSFHVRDGGGLRWWQDAGREAAIISGRASPSVSRRAEELGIKRVIQGTGNKLPALRVLLAELDIAPEHVCVMGDDLPDLPLLRNCGLGIAVADACPALRAAAKYVTLKAGGQGAVREVIEMLLRGQNLWQPMVDRLHAERL
ncbi:MAG: HAD hydrolase family protein [Planctomycetes bacterium]|nr:HAD hydrolase family protein [Planctomycetota bacterium]